MNAQPLSREDNPSISLSSPEAPLASTAKTSTTKASTTKASSAKTSSAQSKASTTSTAKTSTTKTPRKTVAKTATRRHTATKSVPIVDFPTPDNVRSIPIQPDYPPRLATPSLTEHPASDRLRSQLAACHQVLTALQAESQELQQTMASLIAIASEMETLKPTHGTLTALTTPTPRKTSTRKTASKSVSQPEKTPQTSTVKTTQSKTAQATTQATTQTAQPTQPIDSESVNYWGAPPQSSVQPTHPRIREIQLPNLTPAITPTPEAKNAAIAPEASPATPSQVIPTKPSFHSSSLRPRAHSLTRQTVEYYAGYSQPPVPLEPAKPSFKSQSQPPAKPVSQFVVKPIVQPAVRSISRKITKPVSQSVSQPMTQSVKFTSKSSDISSISTQASIVPHPLSARPTHLRLNTVDKDSRSGNRRRYTLTYLYSLIQQTFQPLIPIPKGESAILFDAFCWTLSAIGIRMSCQLLINLLPILTLPLNFLLLFPALLATYLAFCIPKSSSAAVYRCLLITLGFFIGGKL